MLYEGYGERGGCQNMCQTLNNERGYWDHPQTQKAQMDCFIRAASD